MIRNFTLIKLFSLVGNIVVPLYAFVCFWIKSKTVSGFLFFLFITFCIIERAWETFKTSREEKREEFQGDWTLAAVTGSYLLLFFATVTEFYFLYPIWNITAMAIAGAVLLIVSVWLRFWGMAALGKQWAIHAIGVKKIKRVRLVKIGPYKYLRHPIYLAIMLEEISFPLIANTKFSLFFAFAICIPLVIIRAFLEEKASEERLGSAYSDYKRKVPMFFSIKKMILKQ